MGLNDVVAAMTAAISADAGKAAVTMRAGSKLAGLFEVRVRTANHEFVVDEPPAIGGGDAGPSPVELTLAALGSCQAITYRLWAEKLGIVFDHLQVEVESDLDVRGFFGIGEHRRPGMDRVRVRVAIAGPESAARYEELRAAVDRHCPVLDMLRNRVEVTTAIG